MSNQRALQEQAVKSNQSSKSICLLHHDYKLSLYKIAIPALNIKYAVTIHSAAIQVSPRTDFDQV